MQCCVNGVQNVIGKCEYRQRKLRFNFSMGVDTTGGMECQKCACTLLLLSDIKFSKMSVDM